ncbi:hypothetical protein HS041_05535 [Planomonospora sp. ID67723]|uniref:hypothetical protein n=1 Tax=Planomonospora sp. ID67723 TaxID=2738134 RepID=UPI0018C4086D|nr:hypothetical protein [Planomonospora sp. ID67723]MBG0827221.1 hypothetical protein [Planomonospora sp. ID67723]
MTRRSRWLWALAVFWSAAPAVCPWILDLLAWIQELLAPPEEYGDSDDIHGMVQLFSRTIGDLCQLVAVLMMVLALRSGRRGVQRSED